MQNILGLIGFASPIFGLLAALHFHSAFRSRLTVWLLVGSVVVFVTVCFQLLTSLIAIAFSPQPGTSGWAFINIVAAHTTWPQIFGNLLFFVTVYLLSRKLRRRGGSIDA